MCCCFCSNVLEAAFYEQKKDFTGISDCMIVSLDDATGDSCVADIHSPSTNYLVNYLYIYLLLLLFYCLCFDF